MTKKEVIDIKYLLKLIGIALFVEIIFVLGKMEQTNTIFHVACIKMLFLLITIAILSFFVAKKMERKIGTILFEYRYPFAFFLLAILVLFDVSGSSIGMWGNYLPEGEKLGLLWNAARAERSDEWATFTPLAFTSFLNPNGAFSYFNSIARGTLTDSFIVYGQPVLDIAIIFRPFQIGYLFLGMSRGLSFYWWSRLIALFLSSLELGMLFTKKDKTLSVLFATLVAFAPIVQWWFSINSLVEMLVAGNVFILMLNQWIKSTSIVKKSIYMIIMGICGGMYILALYPAWMVPLGYFFLALFIWIIYENRKDIVFTKKDFIPLSLFVFVLCGGILYVVLKSNDALFCTLNTAYPGKREMLGGHYFEWLFNYVITLFTGVYTGHFEGARCEYSAFMSLTPLGYLLGIYTCIYMWIRHKKKDILLIVMMALELILDIYVMCELPKILAKVTLLTWSISPRVAQMTGIFQIVLIIRSLVLLKQLHSDFEEAGVPLNRKKKWIQTAITIVVAILCIVFVLYQATRIQKNYWNIFLIIFSIAIFTALFYAILQRRNSMIQKIGFWIWAGITIFSGSLVNPIQKGIDVIYENPLIQKMEDIVAENSNSKWVVDNFYYPLINAPMFAGARTINSTNVYPNLELWSQFDEEGVYEDIYNRYAHIMIDLVSEEVQEKFYLVQPDVFRVKLTWEDIKKIDVKYVLTNRLLEVELGLEDSQYQVQGEFGGYYIYEFIY